ncbi:MAG: cytochrome 51, partial [Proteobacteria bacterium]|nr:cytochrome 51 [Pseudomonadota bacterium]
AFGGGRHKCSGNAFAMFQIKGIISVLLRRFDFELVDPPATYRDDYQKMVVEPSSPCRVRYRERRSAAAAGRDAVAAQSDAGVPGAGKFRVVVDWDLCKGHSNCMSEAPEIFHVDDQGRLTLLQDEPDEALLEKARLAEKYCPTRAIRIVTSDDISATP